MENKLKVEYVDIDTIKPYKNNAKLHPKEQIEQIKKSIENFGMNDPVGIWNNEIVEGHGRILACKELGYKQIPVIKLDHLTDEERKSYIIAHNKLTMNSDFDIDILRTELENLKELDFDLDLTGFNVDELDDILGKNDEEVEIVEDDFDIEPPEEPKAKLGDIYQLGNHFLMCGDSTKEEDVAKLMNGVKADMFLSDPPYNVDYSAKNKFLNKYDKGNRVQKDIENDKKSDKEFYEFLFEVFKNTYNVLNDGACFYVFYPNAEYTNFHNALNNSLLKVHQYLVWCKNNHVLGMNDYQYKHEPIFYGWKDGKHKWFSDRSQTTVLNFDKPLKNDLHPTMKPISILSYLIKNNTNNEFNNVLDLFGGSGSTLIACEQLNRNCYMMELDPHYISVIIERYINFTGNDVYRINPDGTKTNWKEIIA